MPQAWTTSTPKRSISTSIIAGGQAEPARAWVAILRYRYSSEAMSAEDRFVNPLGFQVDNGLNGWFKVAFDFSGRLGGRNVSVWLGGGLNYAVSPGVSQAEVLTSMTVFTLLYAVLAVVEVKLLVKYVKAGPPELTETDLNPPTKIGGDSRDADKPMAFSY